MSKKKLTKRFYRVSDGATCPFFAEHPVRLYVFICLQRRACSKPHNGLRAGSAAIGWREFSREIYLTVGALRRSVAALEKNGFINVSSSSKGTVITFNNTDLFEPALNPATLPALNPAHLNDSQPNDNNNNLSLSIDDAATKTNEKEQQGQHLNRRKELKESSLCEKNENRSSQKCDAPKREEEKFLFFKEDDKKIALFEVEKRAREHFEELWPSVCPDRLKNDEKYKNWVFKVVKQQSYAEALDPEKSSTSDNVYYVK